MLTTAENNKRIAKNTLLLYLRLLFIMVVSLYTSRVVLNTLGVEDFGIYNVVGGVVAMLAFFNSSMTTSTQRFLNYEMGKHNENSLQDVFINSINAHYLIGLISILVLETIGLWFIYNKLNIPASQFDAALWVFHCSVLSLFVSIISTPYNAAIIANEKMEVYAYFSIIEAILKLLIVYLLVVISFNKLKLYGVLLLCVSIVMRVLYNWYCIKNFKECTYKLKYSANLIKQMLSFSGWMLFGCVSSMLSTQGVNILINIFFGPVFNAARAIAVQVQSAVNSFVGNFMIAVQPQIIKSYSEKEYHYMYRLVFSSSKLSFYLLFILTMPVLFYADYLLQIWLEIVPKYSVFFTRLVLVELLISSLYTPIALVNQASGNIRNYQLAISVIFVFNFILTYIAFKIGMPAYSAFIISIILAIVGLFVRIFILKRDNCFPAKQYFVEVILPLIPISMFSIIIPITLKYYITISFMSFLLICLIGLLGTVLVIWFLGLDKQERNFIVNKLKRGIHQ